MTSPSASAGMDARSSSSPPAATIAWGPGSATTWWPSRYRPVRDDPAHPAAPGEPAGSRPRAAPRRLAWRNEGQWAAMTVLVKILLTPALIAAVTLLARRWGPAL